MIILLSNDVTFSFLISYTSEAYVHDGDSIFAGKVVLKCVRYWGRRTLSCHVFLFELLVSVGPALTVLTTHAVFTFKFITLLFIPAQYMSLNHSLSCFKICVKTFLYSLRYHPPSSILLALIGASAFAFTKYPHKPYIFWKLNSSRLLLISFKKSKY